MKSAFACGLTSFSILHFPFSIHPINSPFICSIPPSEVFKMNDIGKRIKHRRKELGYSAEELAEKVGVSPATIYRYEKNDIANMGADKLRPIADALSTTPGALMGWDDDDEDEAFALREEYRRDPDRRLLLSLARHGSARDVRQAAALIEALKATNPDFYDGDDPA